jgi:hypothetical protein
MKNNEQDPSVLSALLQAIPKFVWGYAIFLFSLVLACLAWLFHGNIFLLINLIGVGVCLIAIVSFGSWMIGSVTSKWMEVNQVSKQNLELRRLKEKTSQEAVKTDILIEELHVRRALPQTMLEVVSQGHNFEYKDVKISNWRSNVHTLQSGPIVEQIEGPQASLPTLVRYADIKHQIPEGHNVVGIADTGLITKEDRHIGACVWIIGGSGSGKTSTTSLRLEERSACGHQFYGVDPHWFKDDSLTNAVVGFSDRFLLPMARDTRETKVVLETFLKEFQNRKAGKVEKPFQKITLVVDEVGSLNDPQSEEEEEVLKLLKTITRVCGQEARNFNLGGIFISQQATGLYWIGNVALLIIVHKLLKENQQKLATQTDDKELFASMRVWPRGRSYVLGMGLEEGEGCLVMQQPYHVREASGHTWVYPDEDAVVDSTPLPFPVARKQNKRAEQVNLHEAISYWNEVFQTKGRVPTVKEIEEVYSLTNHQARRLINEYILSEGVSE